MAKSFELQLKEFENMTAEKSELLFKKVCFDLSNSIIMDTAVLSGTARGNWQPDINSIQNDVLEIEDKVFMPDTELTASSIGLVTKVSISSGEAPV